MTTVASDDHAAVCRTLYEFAQGIDLRDWELLESVFLPRFHYDYSSHRAGRIGDITAAEWVASGKRRFDTMLATQHSMTNPRVDVDGDTAQCRMYVEAWHLARIDGADAWCTVGGEYVDQLVRRDGRWLISELRLNRRWTIGDPAVLDLPTAS